MPRLNKLNTGSVRIFLSIVTVILTAIIVQYYVAVRIPGPMVHPIKYRIISGTFAFILDISRFFESITGFPYYKLLNIIVDSFDPIKIRPFDHGQVLYNDQFIDNVLVRIYTPQNVSSISLSPVIIFFHGGGFFFGSIYSHDTMNYHMSMYTGAIVIAVNYQLTPHVHYPTPLEDGIKVARYVINNYQEFNIDPTNVFLSGDSAGGGMAVVVERHLRREHKPVIRGVLLLYPLLQLVNFRLSSYRTYLPYRLLSLLREDVLVQVTNFYMNTTFSDDELFNNRHLSQDDYENFFSKLNIHNLDQEMTDDINKRGLLSKTSHPDTWKLFDENVSPLLADDEILRNTPATFIVACTYDILLSDAQLYFNRLQQLNVKNIMYREYAIFHGVMTAQRLAIFGAIVASIIGYLYQAPNIEGISQTNKVRMLGATMKIMHMIGSAAELLGLSTQTLIVRKGSELVKYVKDKDEDTGLQIENTLIENVRVRIVRPLNSNDNLPAIIYFHGGAFYMGSPDTHNGITSALARLANVVVISVDYRLAPEHPFPAGLDDCYAVSKYVLQHGDSKKLRIDRSRVALAGDSAAHY
ncbi:unnamed protein product [Rotaria magnacalcarata]|uniref:Alpha/beta hydrolase fold-3 domain-containing protein n=1 Tax=Rotaria magnacalcarata TaxID=392030 RepID=A0A8S2M4C1_9BILA|nr:unnamed protein product [Rotaria magnacalcarata]